MKAKIVAALSMLFITSLAAASVTVINYLPGTADAFGSNGNAGSWGGSGRIFAQIATAPSNLNINSLTLSVGMVSAGSISVSLCQDNGSGTAPSAACTQFNPTSPLPNTVGGSAFVGFSGNYAVTTGQIFWIVFYAVSGQYDVEAASGSGAVNSLDNGSSWSVFTAPNSTPPGGHGNLAIQVIGDSSSPPTPPNPIPTLSEWAQIMMMFMMIATVGFYGWRMNQR